MININNANEFIPHFREEVVRDTLTNNNNRVFAIQDSDMESFENYCKFFFIAIALHMIANIYMFGIIPQFIGTAVMCYLAYLVAKSSELPVSHSYY